MRILSTISCVGVLSALLLTQCDRVSSEDKSVQKEAPAFAGFESQVKWGEHEYCQLFRSSTIQLEGQDVSFINLTIIANVTRSGLHN